MSVDNIFNGLASYVNFIVDFLALRAMAPYTKVGVVSGELMSYFFAGILISVVIQYTSKLPFTPAESPPAPAGPDAGGGDGIKGFLEKSQLAIFIPLLLIGTAVMHLALLAGAAMAGFEIGTFKDTINATLASSTIAYPVQAAATRAQGYAKAIQKLGGKAVLIAIIISLGAAAASFGTAYYAFHATAVVHGLTMREMLWPIVMFVAVILMLIYPVGYLVLLGREADAAAAQQAG